ncbi:hypothetical protein [Maribacter sp. 2308TA10-17]|uniref:hypothetical protein n=1 Tax=Maribacter sp. 2308TA10-17 TaxID=3386276 RepID=UPI0039BC504B
MIETEITILINRKSDIELIKTKVIENKIDFPIYFFEFEDHYKLSFSSDYEEWELDKAILESFPNYKFTSNLEQGKKEIRLQISRYQSHFTIETPIDETKYLIKKSDKKIERFIPKVKVLFEEKEQDYYINIVNGKNNKTQETGFLLLKEFRNKNTECEILENTLFKSINEAVQFGYFNMQELVNEDFKEYIKEKKKESRSLQKIPRKIIRNFINACNKSDITGILENLNKEITFEKMISWKTEIKTVGLTEFEKYIKSPNQELCGKDIKIRSNWDINLPNIVISVKYFPSSIDIENRSAITQEYKKIRFLLNENKIVSILEEK